MIHCILRYSEVATDMYFIDISTTSLETRISFKVERKRNASSNNGGNNHQDNNGYIQPNVSDGAEVGKISNNARLQLSLSQWRCFTDTQLLILSENEAVGPSKLDRISEFSIRPPELFTCFDQFGNYYRWFRIDKKFQKKKMFCYF